MHFHPFKRVFLHTPHVHIYCMHILILMKDSFQNQNLFYATVDWSFCTKSANPHQTYKFMLSCVVSSAGPKQFKTKTGAQILTSYPKTPLYTNLRPPPHYCQDKAPHQRCLHSFGSSSQHKRGNKRWEKHLFKQSSTAVLHPFSPFSCSRLAPRSKPPTATPPKPRSTESSGPIHRRDLWSLIAGKWTRGRASLEGRPPLLFSANLIKRRIWKEGSSARAEVRTREPEGPAVTISRLPSGLAKLSAFNNSPSPS